MAPALKGKSGSVGQAAKGAKGAAASAVKSDGPLLGVDPLLVRAPSQGGALRPGSPPARVCRPGAWRPGSARGTDWAAPAAVGVANPLLRLGLPCQPHPGCPRPRPPARREAPHPPRGHAAGRAPGGGVA